MAVDGTSDRWAPGLQRLLGRAATEDIRLAGPADGTVVVGLRPVGQVRHRLEGGALHLLLGPRHGIDLTLDLPPLGSAEHRPRLARWPADRTRSALAGEAGNDPHTTFRGHLPAPSRSAQVLDVSGMLSFGGVSELAVLRLQLSPIRNRRELELRGAIVVSRADLGVSVAQRWAGDRLTFLVHADLTPV